MASPSCSAERPEDQPENLERDRAQAHAAPGQARIVGKNPILWREVFTRAYGRRPLLVKTAYGLVLALICYSVLGPLILHHEKIAYTAAYGLLPVGVLSLLLVAAAGGHIDHIGA